MRRRTTQLWATAVFALLALGCAVAQKINVEFDQTADFSKYHTFAIRGGQMNAKNPSLNNDINRKRIETDITNALTARGLAPASGRPDLIVRYHLGQSRKSEVERYPAGWNGMRTRVVRHAYAEGTLTIDLHDRAGQSLVWRAVATEDKSNASDIAKKLDDMVNKGLSKFPPKK